MDKPKKLKMNAKTFRIITAPIMVLFLIFALALSIITNYFTPSRATLLLTMTRATAPMMMSPSTVWFAPATTSTCWI